MFLPTILFDLGIDPFHQSVPFHQHVGESGAGEDPDNFRAEGREVINATRKDPVNNSLITWSHDESYDMALSQPFAKDVFLVLNLVVVSC